MQQKSILNENVLELNKTDIFYDINHFIKKSYTPPRINLNNVRFSVQSGGNPYPESTDGGGYS